MRGLVNPGGGEGFTNTGKVSAAHAGRLKDVVRSMQRLDINAPVLIHQLACTEPGCPPVETVVAVLGPPRRTWKFNKAISDVSPSELRDAIRDNREGISHADHD